MLMSYEHFSNKLVDTLKVDDTLYDDVLDKILSHPYRYTGKFRATNASTKLLQNITQSQEIKFGDFMENLITEYIELIGYTNHNKRIGCDDEGNPLNADQVFTDEQKKIVYLIEQKMRDDHDSTKKRGQYLNFKKKYELLERTYPDYTIEATMWFVDDSIVKNKKYYNEQAQKEKQKHSNINIHITYGKDLFEKQLDRIDVWNELCSYLEKHKATRSQEVLSIPDFDTSDEIREALKRLKNKSPKRYDNLLHNDKYASVRQELFPTQHNFKLIENEA